ncbi:protein sorting system archaetidylserine decarboxylase [Halopenitus persicus]|uniref:protein sorting system archaetidylserine decarboxylase n=1 Tax=Halopenitus persicus TaxID=1048396 RepID=UPI0022B8B219|nr:protein sorting system archaetidylserine decarboxylase [Halopenitus persicus]
MTVVNTDRSPTSEPHSDTDPPNSRSGTDPPNSRSGTDPPNSRSGTNPPLARVLPFPVVDDAWRLARPPALLGAALLVFVPPAGIALLALALGILWFHRDPPRSPPDSDESWDLDAVTAVSPADGTVSVIREEGDRLRVGVFMNVTDVHVNRAPLSGTVEAVRHRPGAYKPAFSKDSDRNEQLVIDCGDYELFCIAGWFARRIHPHVSVGDELERGQRVGHVSFGSRADVLFPPSVDREDLRVREGETVRAGETVIADV